ncbi:MAG: DUF5591 domain-containing protein, partial [Candidatus Methanofastidiosia archaeon]
RKGIFHHKKKTENTPCLVEIKKEHMRLGKFTLERPFSYPLREFQVQGELKSKNFLRACPGTPKGIACRFQEKNKELDKESAEITPIYLSGIKECDLKLISSLREAEIFLFDMRDERTLLEYFFFLRKKFPNALIFCNCGAYELPVLAFAGFDLFPDTKENRQALANFLKNPTPHYVEMVSCASLRAKKILNLLYLEFGEEFEKYIKTPDEKELYISRDSFWRPSATRWERQIIERYNPTSNFFILLPCSAKKPYSISQSHRQFISVMKQTLKSKYASLVQLIVTSPYGVVPRELETLIDYDIVVTGRWTSEEIERSRRMLESIISMTKNPVVISHLPENEIKIIDNLSCDTVITSKKHSLSPESLETLKLTLEDIKEYLPAPQKSFSHLHTLSKFLYGTDILPENIIIKGRSVKQIFSNGKCIASLDSSLRPLSKNIKVKRKWVKVDFDIKGDLFCPGVLEADPNIRPGDEVIITRKEGAVAVGRAVLPGELMTKMRIGKAVRVKKRLN